MSHYSYKNKLQYVPNVFLLVDQQKNKAWISSKTFISSSERQILLY